VSENRSRFNAAIFDLGGVLIDWNPRHLYRTVFRGDEPAMERFLAEIATSAWNKQMDGGKPFAEAIAELQREHPEHREPIAAYWQRWPEMLGPVNAGTAQIVRDVRDRGLKAFALSDWSAETFPLTRPVVRELELFDDIQISGDAKITKPDPRAFEVAIARFKIDPSTTFFVDDAPANIAAARAAGLTGILFTSAADLHDELVRLGVLTASDDE
jgi:2-haloacid dehalogenase